MSWEEIGILSETLQASSRGKEIETPYRAVLIRDNGHYVVSIQQCVKGNWSGCGRWHLTTLLFGYPINLGNKPNDGLSLDFGQEWQVDSGMLEALTNALEYI